MRVVFDQLLMDWNEDPEIYAAEPIINWERSEKGQWAKDHSTTPVSYTIINESVTYNKKIVIYGDLNDEDHTFYRLKWS